MSRMLGWNIWARRRDAGLWVGSGCAVPRRTRSAQRFHERQQWDREQVEESEPDEPLGAHPLRRGAYFEMAKMLMDAADRGDGDDRDDSHRTEQRKREERQWRKEAEMPEDEAAQADRDNDPEPDCKHGCNGDCLLSGSEVCTWQCHTYDAIEPRLKARVAELERTRWEATRDIYAIKDLLSRLAADEMTRMSQDWED